MKKIFVAIAMFLIAIIVFAKGPNGLLWKISGNSLSAPSYILGSHHLAPVEFIDSIPGLNDAINSVSAVYGEVTRDALLSNETQQVMMAHALAPADSTLSKILTPTQLAQVDSVFTIYTKQPGFVSQMNMAKPALLSTQLTLLQTMAAFPQANFNQPFDAAVMARGEAQGKMVGGLETIESQVKLLLDTPLTTQAEDLMDAVRNNDNAIHQATELTNAYLAQDLDAVTAIATSPEYGADSDHLDRLIYSRNRQWVMQLPMLMHLKPILVVVGCGHLGGDQGVLNLLRQKGFTVEPVTAD